MKINIIIILSIVFLLLNSKIYAQSANMEKTDTVSLTLNEAEQRLISQDLAIIAARYNVEIAKTNVLSAKLWYNPNITYGQTLFNNGTGRFFDISNPQNNSGNGEWYVQLQQLISYAGRHTNLVKLNKIDLERSSYVFEEVVRALKLEMYNDFSTLMGDQQKVLLYQYQISALNNLISATKKQISLGVSSKNDLIRLEAEAQDDRNQLLAVESELQDNETDLKIILHYPLKTFIKAKNDDIGLHIQIPSFAEILNAANQNRGDLKLAHKTLDYQVQNLKLQRSLAVPDLSIGVEYDKAGGAGYDYSGISLSSDVPVFNRNQGELKAAKIQISQAEVNDSLQTNMVQNQVEGAYLKLINYKSQYDLTDMNYSSDLDQMGKSAIDNYKKQLISLLDFLDQMRSYTEAKAGLIDAKTNYFNAIQNINYQVGTTIIK